MSINQIKLSPHSIRPKRLGEILLEADLISIAQIEVALHDKSYNPDLYLGQILAMRNWIQQETADFFAREWPDLIKQKSRKPIGWYLQQAALLQEPDIKKILNEQKRVGLRFGQVAILHGHLKPTTLDFFLMYLFPQKLIATPCKQLHDLKEDQQLPPSGFKPEVVEEHIEMPNEEIQWIG